MKSYTVHTMTVGQEASFTKTISETDVYLYAGITADVNPAHLDAEYAKKSRFGGRVAHGMLTAGLISGVLGTQLPGPGCIYMGQSLKFLAPVRFGDTITATVRVKTLDVEKNRCTLQTTCTNQEGTVVLDGEALVMPVKE